MFGVEEVESFVLAGDFLFRCVGIFSVDNCMGGGFMFIVGTFLNMSRASQTYRGRRVFLADLIFTLFVKHSSHLMNVMTLPLFFP